MKKDKLICFTASYPFGLKETFFDNELPFLAKSFQDILIIPVINTSDNKLVRPLPSNVEYISPTVSSSKFIRMFRGLFNRAPIWVFIKDFFRGKVYVSPKRLVHWFNSLLLFRSSYVRFDRLVKERNISPDDTMLYSYWGEAPLFTTNLSLPFFKIVRMHRIDFYEEVNAGYLPLRKKIYSSSNLLLPISDDIKNRLINDYQIDKDVIYVSRLGVDNCFIPESLVSDSEKVIRIVSCSRVDPVKRVHLILEALRLYNGPHTIEWHHFGDGSVFESLKIMVEDLKSQNRANLHVVLHGWTTQADLAIFYKSHFVDWLVNVSESEGIPVSIMEAMSYGIPVIATNVGATSEIVNDDNGFLLEVNLRPDDLITKIVSAKNKISRSNKRTSAYETWKYKYQACDNYSSLVDKLDKFK